MIALDTVLIEFIQGNVFTIGLVLSMLKIAAKYSPTTLDDDIVSYLMGVFTKEKK